MASDIRYMPGGDNRLLRHVLRVVWNNQCYWCMEFKKYSDLEIDHIFPQQATDEEKARIKKEFNLPDSYDVHAPGNLAPICGGCNKSKKNTDLTDRPVVINKLMKAQKRAPEVRKRYVAFGAATDLGAALLTASEVDLADDNQRSTFIEGAPAVVLRLAEVDDIEADFYVGRVVTVEAQDKYHRVNLRLNEHGRFAVTVIETIAGGDLAHVLQAPVTSLLEAAERATADALADHDDGLGAPDVGSVEIEWPTITIDVINLHSTPPASLEIELEGILEGHATGSVARDAPDGGSLEYVQGEATFTTRFAFTISWDPTDPVGEFYFAEVLLDDYDADTYMDGRASIVWEDLYNEHVSRHGHPGSPDPDTTDADAGDDKVGTDVEW